MPYMLIFIGLIMLFFLGQPIPAGVFLLLGIVIIFDRIWPEEWKADKVKEMDIQ